MRIFTPLSQLTVAHTRPPRHWLYCALWSAVNCAIQIGIYNWPAHLGELKSAFPINEGCIIPDRLIINLLACYLAADCSTEIDQLKTVIECVNKIKNHLETVMGEIEDRHYVVVGPTTWKSPLPEPKK